MEDNLGVLLWAQPAIDQALAAAAEVRPNKLAVAAYMDGLYAGVLVPTQGSDDLFWWLQPQNGYSGTVALSFPYGGKYRPALNELNWLSRYLTDYLLLDWWPGQQLKPGELDAYLVVASGAMNGVDFRPMEVIPEDYYAHG